jgi:hypothetical protein
MNNSWSEKNSATTLFYIARNYPKISKLPWLMWEYSQQS